MSKLPPEAELRAVEERRSYVLLLGLVVLGAFLRLYCLDAKSFWIDELITGTASFKPLSELFLYCRTDVHPPLYYLLIRAVGVLSREDWALRLVSAILGIATVPLGYLLGRSLFRHEEGIVTAALVATSPFLVQYSQEARSYSLLAFLSTLSFFALWHGLRHGSRWAWWVFALATALNFFVEYLAFIVLTVEGLVVVAAVALGRIGNGGRETARRQLRQFTWSTGFALLVFVPWATALWSFLLRNLGVLEDPNLNVGRAAQPTMKFLREIFAIFTLGRWDGRGLALLSFGLFAVLFVAGAICLDRRRLDPVVAALLWLIVPFVILFATKPRHTFQPRVLIFVVPILLVVVARGICVAAAAISRSMVHRHGCRTAPNELVATILTVAAIAGTAPGLASYYETPKEEFRAADRTVAMNSRPGDAILVPEAPYSFVFYARDLESQVLPAETLPKVQAAFADHDRTWLVYSAYTAWRDKERTLLAWIRAQPHVELAADSRISVYYLRRGVGSEDLLDDAARFALPRSSGVNASLAETFIAQGRWKNAIPRLEVALAASRRAEERSRLRLQLEQLIEKQEAAQE